MQSKQMFVFVTTRALRSFVASNQNNRLLPKLLSINDFFSKIIQTNDLRFIDNEHRFLLLKKACQLNNFHHLGLSNQFNDFLQQSEYLFRFFQELSSEKVDIDSLKEVDTYEFYHEHLDILKQIQHHYINALAQQKYVDKISLAQNHTLNSAFISSFEEIEIFFEGYFTQFEFDLIKQTSQYTTLIINLQTNAYNEKSYKKFEYFGFNLQKNRSYRLNVSNQTILDEQEISTQKNIQALEGFNLRMNQIAFVKHSIYTMVQKGISPQNIVVIVPDEKFSFYLQLFDSQNYFNYAMGKSIQNSSLYIDAHALYEYLNEKEHQQKAYIEFIELCFDAIKTEFEPFFNQNITEALLNALIEFLKTREQNQEILEKFDEKIYTLKQLLFKYEEPILFKEAFKFLLQKISEITLDDTSGGKITVMGLLETRGLSFEGVVIVDFNEDIVPKRSIKDKFISTKVKHVAKLPTIKDRENLQKYYYERLCSQAKELYISYVHNETQQISRFAHELFDASSIKASKADELYETILYQTHSIQHLDEKIELDINLADFKWSASSLKRYLTCKRSFYLNYILKLKEHHFGLKPQSFELGSYIHKVLETFFEQNQQVLSVMPNDILNAYFNLQKVKNPYLLLQLGLWQKKLEVFIQNEKEAFKTNRTLFKTEFAFEFEHCNIRLKGVIDRVDCLENSFEIIDYKTSSHLVVDTKRTYENTKDFQLEFYYLAMKRFIEQNPKYHHFSLHPFYYDLHQSCKYEETMLYEKLDILEHILKQLHTKTVNFEKTHDKAACQYCAYKTICCR